MTASKNHKHAVNNPYAQFRDGWTEEQVLNSPKVTEPLTKLMCTPTSVRPLFSLLNINMQAFLITQDGAACCIVASEEFVRAHQLENQAIEIVAQALETDRPDTFDTESALELAGQGMSKRCADKVFAQAGFAPGQGRDEVGVIELHDCFAPVEASEVISRHYSTMTGITSISSPRMLPWVFVLLKIFTNLWRMAIIPYALFTWTYAQC